MRASKQQGNPYPVINNAGATQPSTHAVPLANSQPTQTPQPIHAPYATTSIQSQGYLGQEDYVLRRLANTLEAIMIRRGLTGLKWVKHPSQNRYEDRLTASRPSDSATISISIRQFWEKIKPSDQNTSQPSLNQMPQATSAQQLAWVNGGGVQQQVAASTSTLASAAFPRTAPLQGPTPSYAPMLQQPYPQAQYPRGVAAGIMPTAMGPTFSPANLHPGFLRTAPPTGPSSVLPQVQHPHTMNQHQPSGYPASSVPLSTMDLNRLPQPGSSTGPHMIGHPHVGMGNAAPQSASTLYYAGTHTVPGHRPTQPNALPSATVYVNPQVDAILEEIGQQAMLLAQSQAQFNVKEAIGAVCNSAQTPEYRRRVCLQLLSKDQLFIHTLNGPMTEILGKEMADALRELWPDPKPKKKARAVQQSSLEFNIATPETMRQKAKKRARTDEDENETVGPSSPPVSVQGSSQGAASATPSTSTTRTSTQKSRSSAGRVAKRARVSQVNQATPNPTSGEQSQEAPKETTSVPEKGQTVAGPGSASSSSASSVTSATTKPQPKAATRLPAVNAAARLSAPTRRAYVPSPLANVAALAPEEIETETQPQSLPSTLSKVPDDPTAPALHEDDTLSPADEVVVPASEPEPEAISAPSSEVPAPPPAEGPSEPPEEATSTVADVPEPLPVAPPTATSEADSSPPRDNSHLVAEALKRCVAAFVEAVEAVDKGVIIPDRTLLTLGEAQAAEVTSDEAESENTEQQDMDREVIRLEGPTPQEILVSLGLSSNASESTRAPAPPGEPIVNPILTPNDQTSLSNTPGGPVTTEADANPRTDSAQDTDVQEALSNEPVVEEDFGEDLSRLFNEWIDHDGGSKKD